MVFTLYQLLGGLLVVGLMALAFITAGPTHGTHGDPLRAILRGEDPVRDQVIPNISFQPLSLRRIDRRYLTGGSPRVKRVKRS